ncbi:MAG: metalloprotease PmbA [Gammaproteobacteria bacterium RIFCSPHIGHO2_02_FULL_42_13]|nr:MAG: metalloprotease PmbA [Gammaproteobacteria bacterium RIFCSPHIGHO2_02_FULL_42_13]OGT68669.1 MAG: metalloprotease PmbA [Gammaproteobacteria bacterium RIFCSPLOWO2_02_FULL_42_9]
MSDFDIEKRQTCIRDILDLAVKNGATQAEADVSVEDGYQVNIREGAVDTIGYHCNENLGITVYRGQRKGSVTTSAMDWVSLQEAVIRACQIAEFTQVDPCSGLADANLMATDLKDLDLYHEWNLNTKEAVKLALECEAKAKQLDGRIKSSEGVSVFNFKSFDVYGNTHGFIGSNKDTYQTISCSLIAEQNNRMERDYYYTCSRDPRDLDDIDKVAKQTVFRTVRRLNPQKIQTQKCPIIFEADVANSLISHFFAAISGGNLYRKRSFLLDCLDQSIFPEHINIFERPHQLKGWGSAMFDSDGVATMDKNFITAGVLTSYILDAYSARQLKRQTTGNADGVHNVYVSTSDKDLPQLLREMGNGLLVTELIGQGINLITGDYSRGAFGFWVENGEIQYPVSEVTIAGNLRDMFSHVACVGNDIDRRGNIQTGSILLESMMVAGI